MLVRFVTDNLVKNRLPESVVAKLCTQLTTMLYGKFNNHWHIRNPLIGSGYRAVQCTPKRVDKMLKQAFLASGAQLTDVSTFLPEDLTMWCDPGNVSVRLGADGSIWSLKFEKAPASAPRAPLQPGEQQEEQLPGISPMAITPQKTTYSNPMSTTPQKKAAYSRPNPMAITPTKGNHPRRNPMATTPQKYAHPNHNVCAPNSPRAGRQWQQHYQNVNMYTNPPSSPHLIRAH